MKELDKMASRVWFRIKIVLWKEAIRKLKHENLLIKIMWS